MHCSCKPRRPTMSKQNVATTLQQWLEAGWINAIDIALLQFLEDNSPEAMPEIMQLLVVLLSYQLSQGHVCLDLSSSLKQVDNLLAIPVQEELQEPLAKPSSYFDHYNLEALQQALVSPTVVGGADDNTPLVLQDNRLYLRRYWQYEKRICQRIAFLMQQHAKVENSAIKQCLDKYFPEQSSDLDWQKIACAIAVKSNFSVITGGPGTGKTTTVVKLLLVLQEIQRQQKENFLQIRLAAPTGKAAARLKESISEALKNLGKSLSIDSDVSENIPLQVQTLHKLLGKHGATRRSRYNKNNPLALDVLIIDESSMVDIEMMAQVLDAVPDHARVILLGDKDQLASVEAGAILAELCRNSQLSRGQINAATANYLEQVSGETLTEPWLNTKASELDQHIVMLQKSYRFNQHSGIGQLALAVNQGDYPAYKAVWQKGYSDIHALPVTHLYDSVLHNYVMQPQQGQGFAHYLAEIEKKPTNEADDWNEWAKSVLHAFASFQILCVTREGEWGVKRINQWLIQLLQNQGYITHKREWFEGRPVLVTRNDYQIGLMNGDVGICLRKPIINSQGKTELQERVAFFNSDGSIKWVLPSRLNNVQTVFAMTIHKSQGSEFDHVLMILPERDMPILSRELLYTGITRAKNYFTLLAPNAALVDAAIKRRVERSGGIKWQLS